MKWKRPQRLEIRDQLGQGWSGTVYTAGDLDSPQQVAVRFISPGLIPNVGRLVQILQPGASLGLPHVLPTSLPEAYDGQLFYAMPLAECGSLGTLLHAAQAGGSPPEPALALELIRQVAEGLGAAHTQGILHGNLKPENVLLWEQSGGKLQVQLSDFGLNTLRQPDALSPYLSAEQRLAAPPSVQDDLYGVGALLFEMLTGRSLPLTPETGDLQSLPEPLRKLISRCLGWPIPLTDMSSFLGHLRAAQAAISTSLSHLGVQLVADLASVQLQPGTPQTVQLKMRCGEDLTVQFITEGWPPEWGERPGGAAALRAGSETVIPLHLEVPRSFNTLPRTLDLQVLALNTQNGERELLARWPLKVEVLPFEDQFLSLLPSDQLVGHLARLQVTLRNEGNQTQIYHLNVTSLNESTVIRGAAQKQFELAPGDQYHDILEVALPPAWLTGRRTAVKAVAHARRTEGKSWPPKQASVQARAEIAQRPTVPWWAAALVLGGLIGGTVWAARAPKIEFFALSSSPPVRGVPFTIGWKTSGARSVQLLELPREVLTAQGKKQLPGLSTPQTYTLVARGLLTQRTQQITVQPKLPPAEIVTFKVTPIKAKIGQTVTVQWNVKNAAQVSIKPFGAVAAQGSRQVVLTGSSRFELQAQQGKAPGAADLHAAQTVTLQVPQVQVFKVVPPQVRRGQPVTVTWQVSGASTVRLAPFGNLPSSGTKTLTPTQTSNLTLKASNGQQEVQASAALTVTQVQPAITEFAATPLNPQVGQPLTFHWKSRGAQSVTLRWGNQQQVLPPSGQLTLGAALQMQNVTLVAQGQGAPALQQQHLNIRPVAQAAVTSPTVPAAPTTQPFPATQYPFEQFPAALMPAAAAPFPFKPAAQVTPSVARTPLERSLSQAANTNSKTAPLAKIKSGGGNKVKVQVFRPTTRTLALGTGTQLIWRVSGIKQVTLLAPDTTVMGLFSPQGTVNIKPTRSGAQTYRLVAADQVFKTTLNVFDPVIGKTVPSSAAPKKFIPAASIQANLPVIERFAARPATLHPGEQTTLYWQVSGVPKVIISGLTGPNPDGSFPPTGTVRVSAQTSTRLYILSAGPRRANLRVPVWGRAAPIDSGLPSTALPGAIQARIAPATTAYQALAGNWNHTYGQLNLQVSGSQATGTLSSERPDLPSGALQGTLSGTGTALNFNGFLEAGNRRVALLLRFDPVQQTFSGVYASRTDRAPWCGWRGLAEPPAGHCP